jgi:hypothetical protein
MRKFSKAWISVGAIMAVAVLGSSYQVLAKSESTALQAPYNPESWVAPDYPARFLPPDAAPYKDIDGHRIHGYVEYLAGISERYRDNGHPQFWGRIISSPAEHETADWIAQKFKEFGLSDVHIQTVADPVPQWAPKSWDVTLMAGGQAMKLTSAQPPYGTASTHGQTLDLPIVYVGAGTEADYMGKDVRGKAVLFFKSDEVSTAAVSGLSYGVGDVKMALDHGAAVILVSDTRGGNFHIQAYQAEGDKPIFQLGTEDAFAIRDAIVKGGLNSPPHIRANLDAAWESGRTEKIAWGTLLGMTDETIYMTAHHDGWFDAAGDDGTGVATELGLAEHFAKIPKAQRKRTIVFMSEAGHHNYINLGNARSQGAFGTWWLYLNMERKNLFPKTALFINNEHTAQAASHAGTTGRTDAIEPMWWYAGGPSRPNLTKIAMDAWHEFGVPLFIEPTCPAGAERGQTYVHKTSATDPHSETVSYRCRGVSGELAELGEWWKVVPSVAVQGSNFDYMHTSEDTPAVTPWTGLQAAVQSYAKMIDEVNKLPLSALQRPPEVALKKPNIPMCEAWLSDSSKRCLSPQEECTAFKKFYPLETCAPTAMKD